MGLAASQARLLSLTARLSNSEFEIQSNLNQKNRLSGTSDGITREYENSLNLKKMTMQVYDQNGASQVDLSYRALTNYVKDSLDNPPYIVTDDKNRAVITADMLNAYQIYNKYKASNPNLEELLRIWNNAKDNTVQKEANRDVVAIKGDELVASETDRANTEAIKYVEDAKQKMINDKAQFEADKAEVKRLKEERDNAADNMDITDFLKGDLTEYNKARGEHISGGHSSTVANEAAKAGLTPQAYLDSVRDQYLRLLIQTNGKNGNATGNEDYSNPYAGDATNPAFQFYKECMNAWGCACSLGGNYFLQTYNLFLTNKDAVLAGEKAWQDALLKTYGDDKLNYADYTPPYDENIITDGKNYDADIEGTNVGDGVGGSEGTYIESYKKWQNAPAEAEIIKNEIIADAEATRDRNNKDAEDAFKNAQLDEAAAKKAYDDALKARDDKFSDSEMDLLNKYDPNLYEKMSRDGYNLNYSNDLDKTKWFQEQLRVGKLFIQRFDKQAFEGKSGYVDDSWQSGTVPVSEVQDYEGRAEIKAKYDREMEKLQKVDKSFDLNIKRLESEHQALEVEYDAVKKVIEKNVDSSFKTFG